MGKYAVVVARGGTMRAGASRLWQVAMAAAFGATAALAVALSRGAPVHAALTSEGTGAAHTATSPAPATAGCTAAGLRIRLGPGDRVTADTIRYPLEFTNVSGAPCTLDGYPQVAASRGDGVQVGPAAAHDTSAAARRVLLAPGRSAHAVVDASVPTARCDPVHASGLRVVVPGQTAARYVSRPLTVCAARAAHGKGYLLVRAIQPGASGRSGALAESVRRSPAGARQPSHGVA